MRSAATLLRSSWLWLLASCVDVPGPNAGTDAGFLSASTLDPDGGLIRPRTGRPYAGPQCESAAAPEDGGAFGFDASPFSERNEATGAPGEVAASVAPPSQGALVITEVMADPSALRDDAGEWIELWNPSAENALSLEGCSLDDGAQSPRPLPGSPVIAPLSFMTLARSLEVAFSPEVVLALSLANGADQVALVCGGTVIDRVAYGAGFPLRTGASMSLDPEASDAVSNDSASAWCPATQSYGGDLGTPGEANPDCDAPDADAGT